MEGAKIEFKIGAEIETCIKDSEICEWCSECEVCNNCNPCEDCSPCRYCGRTEYENIHNWLIENGYIEEDYDGSICAFCQQYGAYRDVICEMCNPCEYCDRYRDHYYCPLSYFERFSRIFSDDSILKDVSEIYEDGSCGLEIVSKPFENLKEYYEFLKKIEIDLKDYLRPEDTCGGHTNISWVNGSKSWEDYELTIARNIWYFSDLISYMFLNRYTSERYHYKQPIFTKSDFYRKEFDYYPAIRIKDYAVEIRLLDTPNNAENHLLASVVCLSLSFITTQIERKISEFNKVRELYEIINKYEYFEDVEKSPKWQKHLRDKFKALIRLTKPYLEYFSKELNIDLVKALKDRFEKPQWKYLDWRLEPFKLDKTITKTISFDTVQTTISSFAKV